MKELGIQTTVLHGIPEGLLYYKGEGTADLSQVSETNMLVEQIALQTQKDDRFEFFCAVDPLDTERTATAQDCLDKGAKGIKLYNGYSYAHTVSLDDSRLQDLYSLLEGRDALLMLATNAGMYESELENLLTLHPGLKVICPHYCLSSKSLERLTDLMSRYPNLYTDTSFGSTTFATEGFQTITDQNEAFRAFFTEFQDRILFATNNVVTSYEDKDEDFLKDLYQDYIWILTEGEFESDLDDDPSDGVTTYQGLELPKSIQKKVFWKNWESLVE